MKNKKLNNTRLIIFGALGGYVMTEGDKIIMMELGLPPLISIMGIIFLMRSLK